MPFVRRRPLARAAVIGGGAYVAGKHVANKKQQYNEVEAEAQQAQEMSQQAMAATQAAPPPAASGGLSEVSLDKLKQLASLRDSGVLTDEEFEQEKKKILG